MALNSVVRTVKTGGVQLHMVMDLLKDIFTHISRLKYNTIKKEDLPSPVIIVQEPARIKLSLYLFLLAGNRQCLGITRCLDSNLIIKES